MGLFSPTKVKTSSTTTPVMSDKGAAYYDRDYDRGTNIMNDANRTAAGLAAHPRRVVGLSPAERRANNQVQAGVTKGNRTIGGAQSGLAPAYDRAGNLVEKGVTAANTTNNAVDRNIASAENYDKEYDYNTGLLHDAADFDAIRAGYENRYTNDVVNTTLAGIQEQANREQAARGASAASAGGISSTRGAVADAVAQQLTGQTMASQEAQLRSNAFDVAAKFGLSQSEAMRMLAESGMTGALNRSDQELDIADTRATTGNDYATMLANLGKDKAGLASDELADNIAGTNAQMGLTETGAKWGATTGEQDRLLRQEQIDENRNAGKDAITWNSQIFNSTRNPVTPLGSKTEGESPGPSMFNQLAGTALSVGGMMAGLPPIPAPQPRTSPYSGL